MRYLLSKNINSNWDELTTTTIIIKHSLPFLLLHQHQIRIWRRKVIFRTQLYTNQIQLWVTSNCIHLSCRSLQSHTKNTHSSTHQQIHRLSHTQSQNHHLRRRWNHTLGSKWTYRRRNRSQSSRFWYQPHRNRQRLLKISRLGIWTFNKNRPKIQTKLSSSNTYLDQLRRRKVRSLGCININIPWRVNLRYQEPSLN